LTLLACFVYAFRQVCVKQNRLKEKTRMDELTYLWDLYNEILDTEEKLSNDDLGEYRSYKFIKKSLKSRIDLVLTKTK